MTERTGGVRSPRLIERVAIVTGGTSGLGLAIARALIDESATVVAAGRDPRRGRAVADEIGADFVSADVTHADQCAALIEQTVARHGAVHVLVNSAGVFAAAPTIDFGEQSWATVVDTKFKGTFFCTAAALPHMLDGGWGRVITIGANRRPSAAAGVYVGANEAVAALTRSWTLEHAATGVTFNLIRPGFFETPATAPMRGDPAILRSLVAKIPAGRIGTPSEIASMAVYLASDDGRYIQGAEIDVDGGQALGWTRPE